MKKLLALSIVTAFVFVGCTKQPPVEEKTMPEVKEEQSMEATPESMVKTDEQSMEASASPASEVAGTKAFTVVGDNFAFDVKEIKVKKGDTVKVTFENKEGFHDWVVDEFKAKTKQIAAGASETVEFVANKAGTFEYYCSVGQHRKMGMVGKLIVE